MQQAQKIAEHRRKYERKREEKEIKERMERVKKAREEHERAQRVNAQALMLLTSLESGVVILFSMSCMGELLSLSILNLRELLDFFGYSTDDGIWRRGPFAVSVPVAYGKYKLWYL